MREPPAFRMDDPPTRFLGGRLLLRQPEKGHRAGTDATLLIGSASVKPGQTIVDVGCGVGSIGLGLRLREPQARVHLLERSTQLAAMARDNVALNGFDNVQVHAIDIFDRSACAVLSGSADLVVSNPPFYLSAQSRAPADGAKATAYMLDPAVDGHAAWLRACAALLAPRGTLIMIHRPEALPELLVGAKGRIGGIVVRAVHPRPETPAIRVLLGGVRGSRAPFRIIEPIILHRPDGSRTWINEAFGLGDTMPLMDMAK